MRVRRPVQLACFCGRNSKFIRFHGFKVPKVFCQSGLAIHSLFFQACFPPEVLNCRGVPLECSTANWAKLLMNEFVAWSNFVVLGCPECRDSCYEPTGVSKT